MGNIFFISFAASKRNPNNALSIFQIHSTYYCVILLCLPLEYVRWRTWKIYTVFQSGITWTLFGNFRLKLLDVELLCYFSRICMYCTKCHRCENFQTLVAKSYFYILNIIVTISIGWIWFVSVFVIFLNRFSDNFVCCVNLILLLLIPNLYRIFGCDNLNELVSAFLYYCQI